MEETSGDHHPILDDEARRWLLAWARAAISRVLSGEALPGSPPADTPAQTQVALGCFVSLHLHSPKHPHRHGLRGCIGTFEPEGPLWQTTAEMAVAAATRDPRFPSLPPEELPACHLEISVLTPRRPARVEEVIVGAHGVNVRHGARRGVLLPQVAVAQAWDRETFLAHACRKAGLPVEAWRDPATTIEIFEAEVFSETELPSRRGG